MKKGEVIHIKEKPSQTKSNLAAIGIYMYDHRVFDIVKRLRPFDRGELGITDANNAYASEGSMTWSKLDGPDGRTQAPLIPF